MKSRMVYDIDNNCPGFIREDALRIQVPNTCTGIDKERRKGLDP
jgi:hypothetical protein